MNLSDIIWRIGRRSRQEIERIIKQAIASGTAASDKTVIAALENLMNPSYKKAKLTSLHGRRVGYEGSRVLRTSMMDAFNEASRLSSEKNPGVSDNLVLTSAGACEICAPKEGKSVKEEGWPTYHPSCRCTTVSEVMSPEQFTDNWIDFMKGGSHPDLKNWYENVYKVA